MEQQDIKDIMVCLGEIKGTLQAQEKANTRTTLALIGLIAAQIGVKILGTPILLDIATALSFVGITLMIGVLWIGWRLRKARMKLTKTGYTLSVMMVLITLVQISVYFRELGFIITPDIVYALRIFQNAAIIAFVWQLFMDAHIYHDITQDNECHSPKRS
jgi:hypothetical protein